MADNNGNHNQTDPIPEQITIGEQTFVLKDTPELQALVTTVTKAVQKVEKGKLYDTIEGLKRQVKELGEKVSAMPIPAVPIPGTIPPNGGSNPTNIMPNNLTDTKAQNEYKEMVNQLNASGNAITATDVANMIDRAFRETLPETLRTVLDPVQKDLKTARELQVKSYRDARLAQLGDTVIPELVKGSTEEEIESSIPYATEIRSRYQVGKPSSEAPPPPPPAPPKPGENPPPPIPRVPLGEEQPVDIRNMSQQEFANRRVELEKTLKTQVGAYPQFEGQS